MNSVVCTPWQTDSNLRTVGALLVFSLVRRRLCLEYIKHLLWARAELENGIHFHLDWECA